MIDFDDGQIPELRSHMLGSLSGLNQFLITDSGPRLGMMAGHMTQALILKGATRRKLYSGDEWQYAHHSFSIDMPVDGQIIRTIDRFPTNSITSRFKFNPETAIIFEDLEERRKGIQMLDIVNLHSHWCLHQTFGFKYNRVKQSLAMVKPNEIVHKDTVFMSPPDVLPDGDWAFGILTNVAYLTVPSIIEDGYPVSESWCKAATATAIGQRMANCGRDKYMLNLYGDENNYKPFPEPGDRIRPDGILFGMRRYSKYLGICDMTPEALMDPDPAFDELIFAEPNAEVIDVRVLHDQSQPRPPTPYGMTGLFEKYMAAQMTYSRKLIDVYKEKKRANPSLRLSRHFHQQLVTAIDMVPGEFNIDNTVSRTYRGTPIDDWTVEVKYTYDYVPTVGSKLSGLHGNSIIRH